MSNAQTQPDVVTFTADQWKNEQASEALGVTKSVPKKKEPTPGMKAILVPDENFRSAKKQMKAYPAFRPALDLPEVIGAMIDVCAADPALMERVIRRIVESRKAQLAAMESGAMPAP
ncbi:hypothetical protein PTKU64_94350 (plasmid) [Paraburkholderia terrae]|uniref:Stability/partitioning determinant n=1 Tax=Paraburkholderia terrae TaxID=311230 RepID=A0ABN6JXV1_9BURK|nr:hypothetical protein [Paraburkholderia terrae]BCZ85760.1 hypothetical protein PTKU64_94350 [Paraburkholderia terrae]